MRRFLVHGFAMKRALSAVGTHRLARKDERGKALLARRLSETADKGHGEKSAEPPKMPPQLLKR
jgi:hypothetical protein